MITESRYKREISVVQEISSITVNERNAEKILNRMLEVLNRQMGMLRGTFTMRHGNTLAIEASTGLREEEKNLGRYRVGEGITGHVAETGEPHIVPDIFQDPHFLNRTGLSLKPGETAAFICVPIRHQGAVIGTLSIIRLLEPETDLDRDASLLQIVGNIAADAVAVRLSEKEEMSILQEENRKLRSMLSDNPGELVGTSSEMQKIFQQARQVAASDATVLIRGSTGTGKEMLARAIVKLSRRRDKPFIALNCAALPENLVESELFGHEKGAFTGATSRRIGRAEAADGGTLFLDEIGDLTLQTQVKLLRFLQERTFCRVGSNAELRSDVRFLAATSRNLEDLMARKLFREDLFYRLNIFPIYMPDLTKRRSDIILLAEHFIEKMNVKYGRKVTRISTPAVNLMMSYHWPGNVRELENCIERAILTSTDDCIHAFNLPPSLQTAGGVGRTLLPGGNASLETMVNSYERELIVESLKRNNGNMSAAGRDLGLSPRVMHYKIHKLGITVEWYVGERSGSGTQPSGTSAA